MKAGGRIWAWGIWLAASVCFAACSSSGESVTPDAGPSEPYLDGGGVGGEAAMPPDGKSLCPMGICNYQTGDGCPANMTCAPSAMDGKTPTCEAAGNSAFGTTCQNWTDCARGAICAGGLCRKICCGKDWTGCSATEHCLRRFEVKLATMTVDTGAYLCFPVNNCNALEPASCAAIESGTTCQIADPTGASACLPEGTGVAGDVCPCKGGYTCVSNGCRRLCKAVAGGGDPACPASEGRCVHFNRDPVDVGECTPI